MACVLAVGIATIDLVQVVDRYPAEDDECRARDQFLWRGGNATNTLVALSQLGHACRWWGTLADDALAGLVCADLDRYRVDYSACPVLPGTATPTSHITLTTSTGSRTILHYRDLPELADDATLPPLADLDWLHVEGRNIGPTLTLLQYARQQVPQLRISLEIEKPRPGIEALLPYADEVLFSRGYARAQGYHDAGQFLQAQAGQQAGRVHVCAWGEQGAWLCTPTGELHLATPQSIDVLDSRAAGDVFNAGWIHARLAGETALAALRKATWLATNKCTHYGIGSIPAGI